MFFCDILSALLYEFPRAETRLTVYRPTAVIPIQGEIDHTALLQTCTAKAIGSDFLTAVGR